MSLLSHCLDVHVCTFILFIALHLPPCTESLSVSSLLIAMCCVFPSWPWCYNSPQHQLFLSHLWWYYSPVANGWYSCCWRWSTAVKKRCCCCSRPPVGRKGSLEEEVGMRMMKNVVEGWMLVAPVVVVVAFEPPAQPDYDPEAPWGRSRPYRSWQVGLKEIYLKKISSKSENIITGFVCESVDAKNIY